MATWGDDFGGYGGGGGDGGGGGGYMPNSSQGEDGGSKGTRFGASQRLFPLTVARLLELPTVANEETTLLMGNKPFKLFELYGKISNIRNRETNNTYTFDDGTATMDAMKWANDETSTNRSLEQQLGEGTEVCIEGQVRVHANVRTIDIMKIRPVVDVNEVNHHLYNVVFCELQAKKGPLNDGASLKTAMGGSSNIGAGGVASNYNAMGGMGGLTGADRIVFDLLSADESELGMHLDHVINAAKRQGVTVDQVRASINALVTGGQVYSTSDDHHFKSTHTG